MFDLVEGSKIVMGRAPTTAMAASAKCDYVEMKNAHSIWAVVYGGNHACGQTITPYIATDCSSGGVTAITGGAQFWISSTAAAAAFDRMTASTNSTAASFTTNATDKLMVVRYDPAHAATVGSSFTHYTLGMSTKGAGAGAVGTESVVYHIESRYPGYQQIIATTSST